MQEENGGSIYRTKEEEKEEKEEGKNNPILYVRDLTCLEFICRTTQECLHMQTLGGWSSSIMCKGRGWGQGLPRKEGRAQRHRNDKEDRFYERWFMCMPSKELRKFRNEFTVEESLRTSGINLNVVWSVQDRRKD